MLYVYACDFDFRLNMLAKLKKWLRVDPLIIKGRLDLKVTGCFCGAFCTFECYLSIIICCETLALRLSRLLIGLVASDLLVMLLDSISLWLCQIRNLFTLACIINARFTSVHLIPMLSIADC